MKHNSKLITVLLVVMLVLGLTGCKVEVTETTSTAEQRKEVTDIAELFTDTFPNRMSSAPMEDDEEKVWKGLFSTFEPPHAAYMVTIKMSDEEAKALAEISFDDEDAGTKTEELLKSCKDIEIKNISDRIPTQEKLDELYKGKTFGDLEADEFYNSGNTNDEKGHYKFWYDGPEYCVVVTPPEDVVIEDMDDYSQNDIRALEIGSIEFASMSGNILDE